MKTLLLVDAGGFSNRAKDLIDAVRHLIFGVQRSSQQCGPYVPVLFFDGGESAARKEARSKCGMAPTRFEQPRLELQRRLARLLASIGAAVVDTAEPVEAFDLLARACRSPCSVRRVVASPDPSFAGCALSGAHFTMTGTSFAMEPFGKTYGASTGHRASAFYLLSVLCGMPEVEACALIESVVYDPLMPWAREWFPPGEAQDEIAWNKISLAFPSVTCGAGELSEGAADAAVREGLLTALRGPRLQKVEWAQCRAAHAVQWLDALPAALGLD